MDRVRVADGVRVGSRFVHFRVDVEAGGVDGEGLFTALKSVDLREWELAKMVETYAIPAYDPRGVDV